MQPETTDKLTEDTNVNEKKILSRATLNTITSTGGYWTQYGVSELVKYAKTDSNNYCIDGYFGNLYGSYATISLMPINHLELNSATGKMAYEARTTAQAFTSGSTGWSYISTSYILRTGTGVVSFENMKAYRIIYATAIAKDTLW